MAELDIFADTTADDTTSDDNVVYDAGMFTITNPLQGGGDYSEAEAYYYGDTYVGEDGFRYNADGERVYRYKPAGEGGEGKYGGTDFGKNDESEIYGDIGFYTEAQIRELWDAGGMGNTTDQFDSFEEYMAYIQAVDEFRSNPEYQATYNRRQEIARAGLENGLSPSEVQAQIDAELGEAISGYEAEWQTIRENYGVDDIIRTDNGDVYKWNGYAYTKTYEVNTAGQAMKAAIITGLGIAAGMVLGPTAAAGLTSALQGGDVEDILTNMATAYLTSGLGHKEIVDGLNSVGLGAVADALQNQNFYGAFTRGSLNTFIAQAIQEGKIDLEDIVAGGFTQMGMEILQDMLYDAAQTRDEQYMSEEIKLNGMGQTLEDVARLSNTSDLYGLLGPEGFLSQMGFDVGYMPTEYLGDLIDWVQGTEIREYVVTEDGKKIPILYDSKTNKNVAIMPDGTMLTADQAILNGMEILAVHENGVFNDVLEAFFPGINDPDRYDERFFDPFAPRGEDTGYYKGIWERNPIAYKAPDGSIIYVYKETETGKVVMSDRPDLVGDGGTMNWSNYATSAVDANGNPLPGRDEYELPPEEVTEDVTTNAVEEVVADAAEGVAEDTVTDVATEAATDATEEVTADAAEEKTEDVVADSVADATEEVTAGVTTDATEDAVADSTDDSAEELTEETTKESTEEVTNETVKEDNQELPGDNQELPGGPELPGSELPEEPFSVPAAATGMLDPTSFMTTIPYAPPVIEAIQQPKDQDYFGNLMQQANMFNRKDYDSNSALDGVILRNVGMFEGMV